jgi:hypothetical protein
MLPLKNKPPIRLPFLLAGFLLLSAALAACAPRASEGENGIPPAESPSPPVNTTALPASPTPTAEGIVIPEQLKPAWEAVAQERSVSPEEVQLQQYTFVEWSDSCLGAAGPEEMCLQVITPGYRAVFSTPQGEVVVHTDSSGQIFRIVSEGLLSP